MKKSIHLLLGCMAIAALLNGCANDDALYAPWPATGSKIDTEDFSEMSGAIALGHTPKTTFNNADANAKKYCVTNPQTMATHCTLIKPSY